MKVYEAISKADALRINKIEPSVKVQMLSELDGRIDRELLRPYGVISTFTGYDEHQTDEELLAPYPYDSIYVSYLEAEICRLNGEMVKYNAARTVFAEKYEAFKAYFLRTHEYVSPHITIPTRRF